MELLGPLWVVPISIIPGLGMLVLSTSARYMSATQELREHGKGEAPDHWLSELVYKRVRCLQQALLSLYLSIASFIVASLLIATISQSGIIASISKWAMLAGGLFAMYSAAHLVYEVFASRKIIEHDYNRLQRR
jgi:polyferredoxin